MVAISSETGSILGNLQQTLRKIPLKYSDALYDWQSDLVIRKNKDRENVSSRSTRGVSLRAFRGNGRIYANSNKTDPSGIRKLCNRLKTSKSKRGIVGGTVRGSALDLITKITGISDNPEIVLAYSFGCVAPYIRFDKVQISGPS